MNREEIKQEFYSINLEVVQSYVLLLLIENQKHLYDHTINKDVFMPKIDLFDSVDQLVGDQKIVYLGLVMWVINNGHLLGEEQLTKARDLIVEEMGQVDSSEYRQECLIDEIQMIDHQLNYKEVFPSRIKVIACHDLMWDLYIDGINNQ